MEISISICEEDIDRAFRADSKPVKFLFSQTLMRQIESYLKTTSILVGFQPNPTAIRVFDRALSKDQRNKIAEFLRLKLDRLMGKVFEGMAGMVWGS